MEASAAKQVITLDIFWFHSFTVTQKEVQLTSGTTFSERTTRNSLKICLRFITFLSLAKASFRSSRDGLACQRTLCQRQRLPRPIRLHGPQEVPRPSRLRRLREMSPPKRPRLRHLQDLKAGRNNGGKGFQDIGKCLREKNLRYNTVFIIQEVV